MKALLFNIHDVILLLTIAVYALLIAFTVKNPFDTRHYKNALLIFFGLNASAALYTLVFWSEVIRYSVFEAIPSGFLLLNGLTFLLGPALLLVHRTQIKSLKLDRREALHFLPALLGCSYLYAVCFRFDTETQSKLYLDLGLYQVPEIYYFQFVTLAKLIPVVYAFFCLVSVTKHSGKPHMQQGIATRTLVAAYLLLWVWAAITHIFGRQFPGAASDYMGIAGNYLHFFITLRLLYERTRHTKPIAAEPPTAVAIDETLVEAITKTMAMHQPYLNPQITLERFADLIGTTPREISTVLNRRFEQNFHEFINRHRVEAAKQKLLDPEFNSTSIQEIARECGFNSKATFNRFFKKFVLCTPSEYRKKNQEVTPGAVGL